MGAVAAPQPDFCPRLPACWQADGLLSEAQCETLVYAAQAFARDLQGQFKVSQEGTSLELCEDGHSYRQGFFLGDGPGAGHGRQIDAVIMDRWQIGRASCRESVGQYGAIQVVAGSSKKKRI